MAEAKDTSKPTLLSNIIALVGFFFILIVLIWGLMNITRWLPGLFSFLNSPSKTLSVSIDKSAVLSGTPTTISWTHNAKKGSYVFTYECRTGTVIKVAQSDNSYTPLSCATAYAVSADGAHAIRVVPEVTNASLSVPVTITYRDEKSVAGASGSANLNITFATPIETPSTPKKPTTGATSTTPKVPDLAVRMIGVGTLTNGTYSAASTIRRGETIAFRFEVKNVGGAATGNWNFVANMPSTSNPSYSSVTQQSLNPGDRIEYTLSFNNVITNGGQLTLTVDPSNFVKEISELNNQLSYQVTIH